MKQVMKMIENFIRRMLDGYKPTMKETYEFKYYTMVIYPK